MQILCATDFSKPAMAAAEVAAALAKRLHLPLKLMHCGADFVVMGDLPLVEVDEGPAREQLNAEAARLRGPGIELTTELRCGSPGVEIIAAATAQATRMIVLASTGKGMAERWLVGSVAERVAEGAPVPTLIVRTPDLLKAWLECEAVLRLLCGVDFTASADAAIAATQTFVALGAVEIEAAYVRHEEDPIISKEQQSLRQRDVWERMHGVLGDVPVKVLVRDAAGQPANEFLRTADERKSGLLVIGTHQRHGWQRLKAPSFSRSTLTHATTNVFCVPAAAGEPEMRIPVIRRVLLATNFTDICTEALRHAHSLLPAGGAVHLVHVCAEPLLGVNSTTGSPGYVDPALATAQARESAEKQIKALPPALLTVPRVAVTSEVLTHHDVAAAICDAADGFGADVICMGASTRSSTSTALPGSTVQAVLDLAHKPVFVVTPPL